MTMINEYFYDDYDHYDYYDHNNKPHITECVLNGVRIRYDMCTEKNLIESIKKYKNQFAYIGSNNGEIYINGRLNEFKSEHHYFIRQSLKQQRKNKLNKLYIIK